MAACPICKRPAEEGSKFAPFCSDRCKLVDLGRWLAGTYQIPVKDSADDEEKEEGAGGDEGDGLTGWADRGPENK